MSLYREGVLFPLSLRYQSLCFSELSCTDPRAPATRLPRCPGHPVPQETGWWSEPEAGWWTEPGCPLEAKTQTSAEARLIW